MHTIPAVSTVPDFLVMLAGADSQPDNEKEPEELEEVAAQQHVSHGDTAGQGPLVGGEQSTTETS